MSLDDLENDPWIRKRKEEAIAAAVAGDISTLLILIGGLLADVAEGRKVVKMSRKEHLAYVENGLVSYYACQSCRVWVGGDSTFCWHCGKRFSWQD